MGPMAEGSRGQQAHCLARGVFSSQVWIPLHFTAEMLFLLLTALTCFMQRQHAKEMPHGAKIHNLLATSRGLGT